MKATLSQVMSDIFKQILRFEQTPPSTLASLRPLQQIPPHPRDFDSKFPSALLDIKQNQTGKLLWRDTGGRWQATLGYSAGFLAGSIGGLLWWDTRRDPLASYSGGIPLASYSTGGLLWWDSAGSTGEPLWRDTRRDPLASRSGGILGWAGSIGQLLWRDTQRDPLASSSSGRDTGRPLWRAALAGYWAGSTGELLWRILGGIHWRAALAGYSAGELLWRDTRRDPLASCSGGILSGSVV